MANRGCCVPKCNNNPKDEVSFHTFPKDAKLRKQWIANITKASKLKRWSPSASNVKVCSAHFEGGRKTSDSNVPTVFTTQKNNAKLETLPRKMSARQLAKKALEAVAEKQAPAPSKEKQQNKEEKPAQLLPVQVKKAPSPVPQQNMVKKPPGRAQPKKPQAKPQRGKPTKKQKVRSRSMSAKDEIKQEEGFTSSVMSPKVLQRFIREDHLYCLPKSDSVSILQKILEEKAKVVETLLERVQTLETQLEEKDLKVKQLQQELQRAQAQSM